MKIIVCFCFCAFLSCDVFSQKDEGVFYLMKSDGTAAKTIEQASFFMHEIKEHDSLYINRYYRPFGPMFRWESYRDVACTIPHGRFAWYNEKGLIDSTGMVYNGKKDKVWSYNMDDTGKATLEKYFERGRLQKQIDYIKRLVTYADGSTESLDEVEKRDSLKELANSILQKAAEFKGGIPKWMKYMTSTIVTPERFMRNTKPGTKSPVTVEFFIGKDGVVGDIFIVRSQEWSVDMETIRVLKKAPKWEPAIQDGQPVIYRHSQTITYTVAYQ